MKRKLFLLANVCCLFVVGQTAQFSNEFIEITQYGSCKLLVDSVKRSWQSLGNGSYYKSIFTPAQNGSGAIWFPCMSGIKREDAEILFGKPNKNDLESGIYFTSKPYKLYLANSFVRITYSQSRLKSMRETFCPGTDEFVKTNFIYKKKYRTYQCPLIPKSFGVDTITNDCLKRLSKAEFIEVLGKPTLQFEGEAIVGMQRIEWDDKGNEIQRPETDKKIHWLRYIAASYGANKNSGFEIKVYPDPAQTTITVYNCDHAADTVIKKWKYNQEKKYFESKLDWTQIDLISKCLYGIDLEAINKIFGPPSKKAEDTLEYYLQPFPMEGVSEPDRIIIRLKNNRLETLRRNSGSFVFTMHRLNDAFHCTRR